MHWCGCFCAALSFIMHFDTERTLARRCCYLLTLTTHTHTDHTTLGPHVSPSTSAPSLHANNRSQAPKESARYNVRTFHTAGTGQCAELIYGLTHTAKTTTKTTLRSTNLLHLYVLVCGFLGAINSLAAELLSAKSDRERHKIISGCFKAIRCTAGNGILRNARLVEQTSPVSSARTRSSAADFNNYDYRVAR